MLVVLMYVATLVGGLVNALLDPYFYFCLRNWVWLGAAIAFFDCAFLLWCGVLIMVGAHSLKC